VQGGQTSGTFFSQQLRIHKIANENCNAPIKGNKPLSEWVSGQSKQHREHMDHRGSARVIMPQTHWQIDRLKEIGFDFEPKPHQHFQEGRWKQQWGDAVSAIKNGQPRPKFLLRQSWLCEKGGLPPERSEKLQSAMKEAGLENILLDTPHTGPASNQMMATIYALGCEPATGKTTAFQRLLPKHASNEKHEMLHWCKFNGSNCCFVGKDHQDEMFPGTDCLHCFKALGQCTKWVCELPKGSHVFF